jgi:hypothetical protein
MLDEEFDVLGEDELALLTRQFERLHENQVNMRRNMRTCFQCGKPRHFVVDCSKKVENKDNYKHKSKTDDPKSKHKSKHKKERRSRKESRGKARAMVGASDVDSSSAYSTSSSSSNEDEGDRPRAGSRPKNLSGLSCFARDGFCTMALSSGNKKSTQSNSDSDSDDEVGDLKNIWLIDSSCSRHMAVDKGWFSCLVSGVTKRYITFRDNGQQCCFSLVVLGFLILEGTMSIWSFPRVRCFDLFFLNLLVLSVVSWLVIRVSCGNGIESWVT